MCEEYISLEIVPPEERDAVTFLPDGGVRFLVRDDTVRSIEIEFELKGQEAAVKYPLVSDGCGVWSLTLYDIPEGLHFMNWYFDGKERICVTAPVLNCRKRLRNYIRIDA